MDTATTRTMAALIAYTLRAFRLPPNSHVFCAIDDANAFSEKIYNAGLEDTLFFTKEICFLKWVQKT
jgi:hypothetical protein